MTATRVQSVEPPPLSIPSVAHEFFFACGCLDQGCSRSGFQADALPYVVAAELRGMAGEILARADMDRSLTVQDVADVLLARAEHLDGETS